MPPIPQEVRRKANLPKSTTISSLTAASNGFTVKWNKQATQTIGYQIQIATDSGFFYNNEQEVINILQIFANEIN